MKLLRRIFKTCLAGLVGFALLAPSTATGAAPEIQSASVTLLTLANGFVNFSANVTVRDLDGIDTVSVTLKKFDPFGSLEFGPIPVTPFRLQRVQISATRDTFLVGGNVEIPVSQRAGTYEFTVTDGTTTVVTGSGDPVPPSPTLPSDVTPLLAVGPVTIDTSASLTTPTVSAPAVAGATSYRLAIQKRIDGTSELAVGVASVNAAEPSFVVPAGILVPGGGNLYAFRIFANGVRRNSFSNLTGYNPATGDVNVPWLTTPIIFLQTEADGTVVVLASVVVFDPDGIATLSAEVEKTGVFGPSPFPPFGAGDFLFPQFGRSEFNTRFFKSIGTVDIPEGLRPGDYVYRVSDGNTTVTLIETLPALSPLPTVGLVTIDTSSCPLPCLTPGVSVAAVSGATHYRAEMLNLTDSTAFTFDNVPGFADSTIPSFTVPDGLLELGKVYNFRVNAGDGEVFFVDQERRSRSPRTAYLDLDPDGDGISDLVDTSPAVFSNDFTDGTNFGTIKDRADLDVAVGGAGDGILLAATGGAGTARVKTCGTGIVLLTDQALTKITCASLTAQVFEGEIQISLAGGNLLVTAPEGAIVTVTETPTEFEITNSPESTATVTVQQGGKTTTLDPGDSVDVDDPVLLLQGLSAGLQGIVDSNPDTPTADAAADVLLELQNALNELTKAPPDNQAAVGKSENAVGKLEASVTAGHIDAAQGTQLMLKLAGIARQIAADAVDEAIAQGGDPQTINEAQQALADGDALRTSGAFKDAVNRYKDALAKAESVLA